MWLNPSSAGQPPSTGGKQPSPDMLLVNAQTSSCSLDNMTTADSSMELSDIARAIHLAFMAAPNSTFLSQIYNISDNVVGNAIEADANRLDALLPVLETLTASAVQQIPCTCTSRTHVDDTCLPWVIKALKHCGFVRSLALVARKASNAPQVQCAVLKAAAQFDLLNKTNGVNMCQGEVKTAVHEHDRSWDWDKDCTASKQNMGFVASLFRSRTYTFPVLASCVVEISLLHSKIDRVVIETLFQLLFGKTGAAVASHTKEEKSKELLVLNRGIVHPHVFHLIIFLLIGKVERPVYMWAISSLTALLASNRDNTELMYKVLEQDWPDWITPVLLNTVNKSSALQVDLERIKSFDLPFDDEVEVEDEKEDGGRKSTIHEHKTDSEFSDKDKKSVFSYEIMLAVLMAYEMLMKCNSSESVRKRVSTVLDHLNKNSSGDVSRVFLFALMSKIHGEFDKSPCMIQDCTSAPFYTNLLELANDIAEFVFFREQQQTLNETLTVREPKDFFSQGAVPVTIQLHDEEDEVQIPDVMLTARLESLLQQTVKYLKIQPDQSPTQTLRASAMNFLSLKHRDKTRERLLEVLDFVRLSNSFLLMLSDRSHLESDTTQVYEQCLLMGSALYSLHRGRGLSHHHNKKVKEFSEEMFQEMMNYYALSVDARHREIHARLKSGSKDSHKIPSRKHTMELIANQIVKDQVARTVSVVSASKRTDSASPIRTVHRPAAPVLINKAMSAPSLISKKPAAVIGHDMNSTINFKLEVAVEEDFEIPDHARDRSLDVIDPHSHD